MRFSGKLMPPVTNYTGKTVISVELEEDFMAAWEILKNCEKVGIDIKLDTCWQAVQGDRPFFCFCT